MEANSYALQYSRRIDVFMKRMYYGQVQRSKKRCHNPPTYNRNQLIEYLNNHKDFQILFNHWVNSGYSRWLAPSLDRLDDSKGYSFDNIQLCTWSENKKRHKGYKLGFVELINNI